MQTSTSEFTRGEVRAVDCFKEGWGHIQEQYWLLLGITVIGIILASLAPLGILLARAGNREEAASMLGIGERTLYRKIKEFNL